MKLDYSKIIDVKIDNIKMQDYPDFVDAFVTSATYDGREMTEEELDLLNEDSAFVHQAVFKQLY